MAVTVDMRTSVAAHRRWDTDQEALDTGCDPAKGPYDGAQLDSIVEIDMKGNIIWEWRFFDHAVQDIDPTKPNYVGQGKTVADYPHRINLNIPGRPVKRDWLHCNSLDYNPELGHARKRLNGRRDARLFWISD
jgi:hypothetical protein